MLGLTSCAWHPIYLRLARALSHACLLNTYALGLANHYDLQTPFFFFLYGSNPTTLLVLTRLIPFFLSFLHSLIRFSPPPPPSPSRLSIPSRFPFGLFPTASSPLFLPRRKPPTNPKKKKKKFQAFPPSPALAPPGNQRRRHILPSYPSSIHHIHTITQYTIWCSVLVVPLGLGLGLGSWF